jgi:hypothetical protein
LSIPETEPGATPRSAASPDVLTPGPFALEAVDRFEILLGRLVEVGVAGHR